MSAYMIRRILCEHSFTPNNEAELQEAIAQVLEERKVAFMREVVLGAGDRIDFLTTTGVGIEVKCAGSLPKLIRQVHRYAAHEKVRALVVAVTRSGLRHLPERLRGKPIYAVHLMGGIG